MSLYLEVAIDRAEFVQESRPASGALGEALHIILLVRRMDAVVIERDIVLPEGAPRLVATLQDRGYRCHELPMTEFIKAGGACKCLTMFMPQREKC